MVKFTYPLDHMDLRLTGLASAQRPYVWVTRGGNEACDGCLRLDGEIRSLEEWQNTVTPGSLNLACRGRGCDCRLEPALEPPTRRAVQTVIHGGSFGIYFFGDKQIRPADLNPPGDLQPRAAPPSYNFPETLPDLRPHKFLQVERPHRRK